MTRADVGMSSLQPIFDEHVHTMVTPWPLPSVIDEHPLQPLAAALRESVRQVLFGAPPPSRARGGATSEQLLSQPSLPKSTSISMEVACADKVKQNEVLSVMNKIILDGEADSLCELRCDSKEAEVAASPSPLACSSLATMCQPPLSHCGIGTPAYYTAEEGTQASPPPRLLAGTQVSCWELESLSVSSTSAALSAHGLQPPRPPMSPPADAWRGLDARVQDLIHLAVGPAGPLSDAFAGARVVPDATLSRAIFPTRPLVSDIARLAAKSPTYPASTRSTTGNLRMRPSGRGSRVPASAGADAVAAASPHAPAASEDVSTRADAVRSSIDWQSTAEAQSQSVPVLLSALRVLSSSALAKAARLLLRVLMVGSRGDELRLYSAGPRAQSLGVFLHNCGGVVAAEKRLGGRIAVAANEDAVGEVASAVTNESASHAQPGRRKSRSRRRLRAVGAASDGTGSKGTVALTTSIRDDDLHDDAQSPMVARRFSGSRSPLQRIPSAGACANNKPAFHRGDEDALDSRERSPRLVRLWSYGGAATAGRAVSCVAWHPFARDILAVGYRVDSSSPLVTTVPAPAGGSCGTGLAEPMLPAAPPPEISPSTAAARAAGAAAGGLIALWSPADVSSPLAILRTANGDDITALAFSTSSPALIAAGLDSGDVAIWDIRAATASGASSGSAILPAAQSRLQLAAAAAPVGAVTQVLWLSGASSEVNGGSGGGGNGGGISQSGESLGNSDGSGGIDGGGGGHESDESLVSLSVCGTLLRWDVRSGLQRAPTRMLSLQRPRARQATAFTGVSAGAGTGGTHADDDVLGLPPGVAPAEQVQSGPAGALCMAFVPPDNKQYVVGTDEGALARCSVAYADALNSLTGAHFGPIHRVRFNPFSPVAFLTCSEDWTVRVWASDVMASAAGASYGSGNGCGFSTGDDVGGGAGRAGAGGGAAVGGIGGFVTCALDGATDAVTDVAWSSTAATVFAAVTRDGRAALWDASTPAAPVLQATFYAEPSDCCVAHEHGYADSGDAGSFAPPINLPARRLTCCSFSETNGLVFLVGDALGAVDVLRIVGCDALLDSCAASREAVGGSGGGVDEQAAAAAPSETAIRAPAPGAPPAVIEAALANLAARAAAGHRAGVAFAAGTTAFAFQERSACALAEALLSGKTA